ncbi:hypothetical protein ACNKHV_19045 [Shigella flexneri]
MISDLGGQLPTCTLRCKSRRAETTGRRLSCVYPEICPHMDTNHEPTINRHRRARDPKGIKKILSPQAYVMTSPWKIRAISRAATHHVGGYLRSPRNIPRRAVIEDDEAGHGQL